MKQEVSCGDEPYETAFRLLVYFVVETLWAAVTHFFQRVLAGREFFLVIVLKTVIAAGRLSNFLHSINSFLRRAVTEGHFFIRRALFNVASVSFLMRAIDPPYWSLKSIPCECLADTFAGVFWNSRRALRRFRFWLSSFFGSLEYHVRETSRYA